MQNIIDALLPEIIRLAGRQQLAKMDFIDISGTAEPPRGRTFIIANGAAVAIVIVIAFVVVVATLLVVLCIVLERRVLAREKAARAQQEAECFPNRSDTSSDDSNDSGEDPNEVEQDSPRSGRSAGSPKGREGVDGTLEMVSAELSRTDEGELSPRVNPLHVPDAANYAYPSAAEVKRQREQQKRRAAAAAEAQATAHGQLAQDQGHTGSGSTRSMSSGVYSQLDEFVRGDEDTTEASSPSF